MKLYPPGEITKYGANLLKENVEPLILYTSHDNGIQWCINGGLSPMPGMQEGAYLVDGAKGLHPSFNFVEHKGARQDGVTVQRGVYEPLEMDLMVEFSAPPDYTATDEASAAFRRVIRDWVASWDPRDPGTLAYITPDMGKWTCRPRLYRSPPERQFRALNRRLRQRYTWTVRSDEAFWRGTDSVSVFAPIQANATQTAPTAVDTGTAGAGNAAVAIGLQQPTTGTLGSGWDTTTSGAGAMVTGTQGAGWAPSGTGNASVINTLVGVNQQQTVAVSEDLATGGHFNLNVLGAGNTVNIPYNATPAQVQTAIENHGSVGAGNVAVSGQNGGPWTVEFTGTKGAQYVPPMVATSHLTGSSPGVTVSNTGTGGAGNGPVGAGVNAVTVTTGALYQAPTGTAGAGSGIPVVEQPSVDVYGWFDSDQQNGVKGSVTTNGGGFLSLIINGITSVIAVGAAIVGSIAHAVVSVVSEVVEVAVGVAQQVVSLVVDGIKVLTQIVGAVIGTAFELVGFGLNILGSVVGQLLPPAVTGIIAGPPPTISHGELKLTNFGDQEGYPRYLCYGPGTFKIGNGAGDTAELVEFGPLIEGQIALLTTLPRLRGVVDLTPTQTMPELPQYKSFLDRLISLAFNNNTPPLLESFQSLFGIQPPQGPLYSLLNGRFTNAIPPKPTGAPPVTSKITVQISGATSSSKIIGALTPFRRWPE